MPAAVGDLKLEFTRLYQLVNPNPFKGPDTWRNASCDEFDCSDCATALELRTILPIDDRRSGTSDHHLYFNITGLPSAPSMLPRKLRAFIYMPKTQPKAADTCLFDSITASAPLFTTQSGDAVHIRYDAIPLPELPTARIDLPAVDYNEERVVDTITSTAPVKSETAGLTTTVSFVIDDVPSLPKA